MANPPLVNIDGWLTDDPKELDLYRSGAINRWCIADQLGRDFRGWKPWAFWLAGTAAAASGVLLGMHRGWSLVLLGASVWVVYLYMLHSVVRDYRSTQLVEATIRFDGAHPLVSTMVVGPFVELGGVRSGRAVLPAWAAELTRRPDGTHRVLVAWFPSADYSPVVGIRPPDAA